MVWTYIIFSYLSLFALGFSDNLRGPIYLDVVKAFSVNHSVGSWMFVLSSLMGFVGGLSVKRILQKMNPISMLQLSLLMMTVGLIGMGGSPSFAVFLVFSGSLGLSMGFLGVLQNLLVSVGSTDERRQQMLGGLHSVYGLSSLIAPLAVSLINSIFGDWRMSCFLVSLVPLSVLVGSFFHRVRGSQVVEKSKGDLPLSRSQKYWMTFLSLGLGFYVAAEILVSTRISTYFRLFQMSSFAHGSFMTTLFFTFLFSGRLLFTFIKFNLSLRTKMYSSLILSAFCVLAGLAVDARFLAFSGFAMAPFFAWAVAYISQHFRGRERAALTLLVGIQSLLIVIMHFTIGQLTDQIGLHRAFYIAPAMLLLSAFSLFVFERFHLSKQVG